MLPLVVLSGIPNPVSSLIEADNLSRPSDRLPELYSEPSVISQDQNLYVVWSEEYAGNREIFFKRSLDNGQSFDQPINLSNTTSDSISPSLVVFENFVKVSWLEQLQSADKWSQLY